MAPAAATVADVQTMTRWWDGIELWLVGLSFPLQVTVTMVVVLPVCACAAIVVDRGMGAMYALFGGPARSSRPERRDE